MQARSHFLITRLQQTLWYIRSRIRRTRALLTVIYDGLAIYDEKAKTVYNKDSKQISLSGMLIIHGDVQALEGKTAFQGLVQIGDEKKQIYAVRKPRLLGVIYSTEIDLL